MSIEVNHLIVPASDKKASAQFLTDILGISAGPTVSHFQPVQIGQVTLDYGDATDFRPMHIAFLVDEDTFDAAYKRLVSIGAATYADPGRKQSGQINHRHGGRGIYFDDPDGHLFELMTTIASPDSAA